MDFTTSNVPAVYDIFAVAIKECGAFQQPQKCGWSERGNGAQRTDLANGRPSPLLRAQRRQSCYTKCPPLHQSHYYFVLHNYFYPLYFIHHIQSFFAPISKPPARHGRWAGVGLCSLFLQKKMRGLLRSNWPRPAFISQSNFVAD
jgi:hypothetical protein